MARHDPELDPQVIRTALGQDETASAGDQRNAFTKLYLHYEPRVRYAVAKAVMRTRSKQRAADIRQDVWFRFSTPKNSLLNYYDPEKGTFGSFISRLAYQQALSISQSIGRKTRNTVHFETIDSTEMDIENPWSMQTYTELIQTEFYNTLLERAAAGLDDEERTMLHELYFNGRSALSFAAAHSVDRNTVYKRFQQFKDKLQKFATEILAFVDIGEHKSPRQTHSRLISGLISDIHEIIHRAQSQSLTIIAQSETNPILVDRLFAALKAVARDHPGVRITLNRQDSTEQRT